ncbi:MAG: flagellar motor switch protein FliG, partial [Treponema sp.]|nr:flagellar motor switch protein FliG [Treponema sp.]
MNMNDLRAMAYGKQQNLGKVENDTKNVKPFIPQTFIKTEKEDEKPAAPKNVKAFVPQKLSKAPETQVQARQPEVKAFKPAAFIKTEDKNLDNKKLLDQAASYLKKGGLIKVPGESQSPDGKDSVYRRVAKFLLLIGEDEAAKILPHLNEKQIERIIPEIASIRTVNKDEANVILAEFNELLAQTKSSGGIETAREMLEKAYGKDKADQMLSNAVQFDGEKPFEYLRDFEEERLYLLLKDENVGVQSMVLSFLQPEKAAKVINQMTAEEKREVVMRLAKMEPVSPDIIRRVSQAL